MKVNPVWYLLLMENNNNLHERKIEREKGIIECVILTVSSLRLVLTFYNIIISGI